LLAAACAAPAPPGPQPVPPPEPVQPAPLPAPGACPRIRLIEVYKQERRLVAHCDDLTTREFGVALGREPLGNKQRVGDERTPEGLYRVAGPARRSRFHLFLPIDYPNAEDADAGLELGRISAADHARIVRAHERGRMPPQDTALGGQLGFHGEGERWRGESDLLDWTYGCVALADDDIDFIAERAPPGTPVRIWR
jgi:murein L,D-transpeptidase YafK